MDFFGDLGLPVDSQAFGFMDPYSGKAVPLVNLIISIDGTRKNSDRIVLMAHWDSRPRTDYATDSLRREQPIDGANDGASGVAVLMELARLMVASPPPTDVDIVLVDGEDWGRAGDLDYYLLGSREFARRSIRGKYRFGLVIDMIGDSNQRILREGFSEIYCQDLNDLVFESAARLGIGSFVDSVGAPIHDDHLSLTSAGVPAVDIIDFDYDYWHTEYDTPDKCSAQSLSNVGKLLMEIVYRPELWPPPK
jgi:Zn-dependent M28 family amino/carboxypeptidase